MIPVAEYYRRVKVLTYTGTYEAYFIDWTKKRDNELLAVIENPDGRIEYVQPTFITFIDGIELA